MLLKLDTVYKNYDDIKVLQDMTFSVNKAEILCVLGPSGCGKSTILNLISGLITPNSGKVLNKANKIGYVFQEDRLIPWKTVYENIAIVSDNKKKLCKARNSKAENKSPKYLSEKSSDKIYELISYVGLKGFEDKYPKELSGGMRQRCSIARAFNYESDLLLMDEPFKSLDYNLRINMINHLTNIWERTKNSIIFVTHEVDEALLLGNRIMVLSNRPTSVLKTFSIDTKQRERKLSNKNLIDIRNEIIELLIV